MLVWKLDTRVPLVYADPDRVLQVLINLIDNGIKFTPPDGSVIVPDSDPPATCAFVATQRNNPNSSAAAALKLNVIFR